ncbi:MotA/TolQ/ExbB proton channel family protein [Pseudaquidulcibacter saccharophilus]|uniref:MotA/TolQ/ExbB proton channel family protein n=1 Tax=Pseudaquidulcibacter saccharophilus TaxID=2831900 RepID=UPI001EFF0B5A|nr:MotA/TolQ/ExbB proton channel family protein [Pseudaquidulcibacter saccharophilus]
MEVQEAINQFSFVELFLKADIIVKIVMIGLGLTSVLSWAVTIDKFFQLKKLEKGARFVEQALGDARSDAIIEDAARSGDATARIMAIGLQEARIAKKGGNLSDGLISLTIERMQRIMQAQTGRELARADKGLGILATIGSAATFVGLFGTVWGIMNSFRSIAASHDTNLAVVAPGIAEALFATAMGLFAAIPAVVFYNWLTGGIDRYAGRVETLCDEIIARASRRLTDGGQ